MKTQKGELIDLSIKLEEALVSAATETAQKPLSDHELVL